MRHAQAHLGCMMQSGDRCNPDLLHTFRERWPTRSPAEHLPAKLTFLLGWLCHRAPPFGSASASR